MKTKNKCTKKEKQKEEIKEEKEEVENDKKEIEEKIAEEKVTEEKVIDRKEKDKKEVSKEEINKTKKKIVLEICINIMMFVISAIITGIIYFFNITVEAMNVKKVIACFASIYVFLFNVYVIIKYIRKDLIFTIIKISFSIIITLYLTIINKNVLFLVCGISEIFFIYWITSLLNKKCKVISNILSGILFFLYNFQVMLFILANNFLTLTMLQNLTSIDGISGNIVKYTISFIVVLFASCIPIKKIETSKKMNVIVLVINVIVLVVVSCCVMNTYSPFRKFKALIDSYISYNEEINKFKEMNVSKEEFYQEGIEDFYLKNSELTVKPNIILIFTEGLSQHIIDDVRDFMPNIKMYQDKSLTFSNYFNHTFATYRGIIGQLYSSFQYKNTDVNNLISIQSILQEEGYVTEFLNTEPNNIEFRSYIKNFGFMKNFNEWDYLNGTNESVADRDAYEELFEKAMEYNENNETFFLSCYTYGTHVTFDGVYNKETDNNIINKFADLDDSFGMFMEKFENSPLYENTIIVFTTDHATYSDSDFKNTFPERLEEKFINQIDRVPLFIYHKGVENKEINVNGRTTIDLAPTILDYLDISKPNYFLGESLFSGENGGTRFDKNHMDGGTIIITEGGYLSSEESYWDKNLRNDILRYVALYKTMN